MTTTTTLVHRVYNGPAEWWREGLVYELNSPWLTSDGLDRLSGLPDHVASLGFGVILLRPSRVADAETPEAFGRFASIAHEHGLRVVVRVSGALGPVTGPHAGAETAYTTGAETPGDGLLERATAFLLAGADGIDLGTIIPPALSEETDLDRLSEYFTVLQGLVAENVDEGVVGADVSADYPDELRHHLQDDWLHHLRDDSLTLTRWDRESLTRHLTRSLADHDRFGAPPVWRYLPPYLLAPEMNPGDGRRWFETGREERERRAMALQTLMLALPGAVYLRQGDETRIADEDKPDDPAELAAIVNARSAEQGSAFLSPLATVRYSVHVRAEHGLARAPLAFVRGMPWCPDAALSLLSRDILVLVNTTAEEIALPAGANVVLSSALLSQGSDGRLVVPPTTTAWIAASTVA